MAAYVEELLRKCVSMPHIKQLQAHLITTGLFRYHLSRAKLLDFCATSPGGSFAYANFMFDHIPQPATNDWNAIIRGLALSNEPTNAVMCYVSMQRASCNPDALTCSFVLKACARSLARLETFQMHSHIVRLGVKADILLQTTLLDSYAKSGELHNACILFDEMTVRDIASWNSLISGLAQGNQPGDALHLFNQMEGNGFHPNEITCLGVLSACSQLGAFKVGEKIHNYITAQKLDSNVIVCNAVIDMYAKCGLVDEAYKVFSSMQCKKNLVTWNTMIMAFGMHGDGVKALQLLEQMREEGLAADEVSYLAGLCACNHAGLVDEGLKLFESMEELGVDRNVKHYGTLVDLLGRSGRLEEAYGIMQSMPTIPDIVLWQTLLGASTTYGNVEMAEEASRKLTEMGSNNCGDFVLLSNVYAARGRWNDVDRIREAMRNRAVKKIPGFSYTEVDGVIHRFINGDRSHPRCEEIYRKLDEISLRIRKFGHVAETNYVLHDIGPEEKENALAYHSEKLAVAFGLLSGSDDGSPISVNKNLRICGDCHVTMKLISKIYDREIIVRDRTRFHKFKDGSCSCRDFW